MFNSSRPGRQAAAPDLLRPRKVEPLPEADYTKGLSFQPNVFCPKSSYHTANDKQSFPLAQALNFSIHCFHCCAKRPCFSIELSTALPGWDLSETIVLVSIIWAYCFRGFRKMMQAEASLHLPSEISLIKDIKVMQRFCTYPFCGGK